VSDCDTCRFHDIPSGEEPCASCSEPHLTGWASIDPSPPRVPAAKRDVGKLRWDLLPWPAVEAVVEVLTWGADMRRTRGEDEREACLAPDARAKNFASLQRHLAAWLRGERTDPETGLPTLAHAAARALFLLALDLGAAGTPKAFEPHYPTLTDPSIGCDACQGKDPT
jgi:hypothetical protein